MTRPDLDRRSWHLDKSVPLALIFTVFMQTVLAVWWAAGITKDVDGLKKNIDEIKINAMAAQGNRYTIIDANKDMSLVAERHNMLDRRISADEERLRNLESRLNK